MKNKDHARKVLIDELIENNHFADLADVMLTALKFYNEHNKGKNGSGFSLITNCLVSQMEDDTFYIRNEEDINKLLK